MFYRALLSLGHGIEKHAHLPPHTCAREYTLPAFGPVCRRCPSAGASGTLHPACRPQRPPQSTLFICPYMLENPTNMMHSRTSLLRLPWSSGQDHLGELSEDDALGKRVLH